MRNLNGTEKQIKWASSVRVKMIAKLESNLQNTNLAESKRFIEGKKEGKTNKEINLQGEREEKRAIRDDARILDFINEIQKKEESRWFIDNAYFTDRELKEMYSTRFMIVSGS